MEQSENCQSSTFMDRMVQKQELAAELDKKASKIEIENCLKYFNLLHN
jgi:hypothetical protein